MVRCVHDEVWYPREKSLITVRSYDPDHLSHSDRDVRPLDASRTSSAIMEKLPPEIGFQILDFLHTDSLMDIRSLSETCYVWNQMVDSFLQQRWSLPTSVVSYTHHDGIIQRLFRQDPQTFSLLLKDVCCNTSLPKSAVDLGGDDKGVCLRLQKTIRRTLQDQQQRAAEFWTSSSLLQQPMVQDLRQQMSDRFLDAISLQQKLAILLYTHTSIGVVLVAVVSIGLFWVKTQDDYDFCRRHSCPLTRIEEEERLLRSPFYMRFLVLLAFACTVAYGISKQTKSQKEKREQSLRRSVSQPEMVGHSKSPMGGGMKRCKTVASGLVTLDLPSHPAVFESDYLHGSPENFPLSWSLGIDDDIVDVDENQISDVLINVSSARKRCKVHHALEPTLFHRIPPRGCVGVFYRVIQHAKERLIHLVQENRSQSFGELNPGVRTEFSAAFLNACSDDNALVTVCALSRSLPTQQFYISPDGTESCALHVAAFHGSAQIIDFLCRGIDTAHYPTGDNAASIYDDGGLCDVNVTDANGWTALHYAAGANSVNAVRVLVEHHGAKLNILAVNGYTPLQWAMRLKHHAVAEQLRSYIESDNIQYQKRCMRALLLLTRKSLPSLVILSFLIRYFVSKNQLS